MTSMNDFHAARVVHGQGKRPVKPLPRHAELAVNMAGSMASFLFGDIRGEEMRTLDVHD